MLLTRFDQRLQPATSLGGVESLCEQRVLVDPKEDPRLGASRLTQALEGVSC